MKTYRGSQVKMEMSGLGRRLNKMGRHTAEGIVAGQLAFHPLFSSETFGEA